MPSCSANGNTKIFVITCLAFGAFYLSFEQFYNPTNITIYSHPLSSHDKVMQCYKSTQEIEQITKASWIDNEEANASVESGHSNAFDRLYARGGWEGGGSGSGANAYIRCLLQEFLYEHDLSNMFDAACGDFRWMHAMLQEMQEKYNKRIEYWGNDIASKVIESHQAQYAAGDHTLKFTSFDLTKCEHWPTDREVIFIWKALQHNAILDVQQILRCADQSNAKWLLCTNYPRTTHNQDIFRGEMWQYDLTKAPYNLPQPAHLINHTGLSQMAIYALPLHVDQYFEKPEISREAWSMDKCVIEHGTASCVLQQFIYVNNVESLFDGSCGDFSWMHVLLTEIKFRYRRNVRYFGNSYLSPSVINSRLVKYAWDMDISPSQLSFSSFNLKNCERWPDGIDLVLLYQGWEHVPLKDIQDILRCADQSNAKWLAITSYKEILVNSDNIWRHDFTLPPFNLPRVKPLHGLENKLYLYNLPLNVDQYFDVSI